MHPQRKRTIRLVVALGAAMLLAVALVYTSFNASTEARQPSELVADISDDRTYQLTGRVVPGSIDRDGEKLRFRVRDRQGRASVPVVYQGAVPDPFREGREVIIDVRREDGVFVGEKDTLVTKCPSKFTEEKAGSSSG